MKGLLVLSHNVEDVEALATRALLVRSGIHITTCTFEDTLNINTAFGLTVKADCFASDIEYGDYQFLIIPGGKYVAETIDKNKNIQDLATAFSNQHKMIAAICAGPRFLGRAGLLDKVPFTCFKGCEGDMPKGIYHPELKALTHEGIITARGAGAVYEFAYEIIKYILGKEQAKKVLDNILY
ncbi:DJ-1/PfpI family protein [Liberiplasma polymorphum]|uniref:DJ-1/PfpI family protein n=1 Tax=Liberiplasma polymorphum TaxID=3374570 RepID=UPI003771EA95